jgi:hypothetical protein
MNFEPEDMRPPTQTRTKAPAKKRLLLALAFAITLVVGFGIGHLTAPTKTVTVDTASSALPEHDQSPTSAAAPSPAQSTDGSVSVGASASASVPGSAMVQPSGTSPGTVSGLATAANGTLLGSYTFNLPEGYSAPLGPTAPTQSQIASGATPDIVWNGGLEAGTGDRLISVPIGTQTTYNLCAGDTDFEFQAEPSQGTVFCLVESTGRIVGVTIASVTALPVSSGYAVMNVQVWQDSP